MQGIGLVEDFMKHSMVFNLSVVSVCICFGVAGAAQDHNSSRSNKTSSITAPDSGSDVSSMKVKEKANRTKSLSTDGSQDSDSAGLAIDEGGTPKVKGGKGHATRKAFVVPHVLEKSGTVNAASAETPPPSDTGASTPSNGVAIPQFINVTKEAK